MSEQADASQAVTEPSAEATPETNPKTEAIPEGFVAVPKDEAEKLERYRQQLTGQNAFVRAAMDAGYKKPEDFKKAKAKDGEAEGEEPTPSNDKRVESARNLGSIDSVIDRRFAEREHASAFRNESALIERTVEKIAGSKASDEEKDILRSAAQAEFDKLRKGLFYEPDHVLASEYNRPVGEAEAKKVAEALGKKFAVAKGARLSGIAAAARSAAPTVGAGAGQGKPGEASKTTAKQDLKDEAGKFLAERARMRAGSTVG